MNPRRPSSFSLLLLKPKRRTTFSQRQQQQQQQGRRERHFHRTRGGIHSTIDARCFSTTSAKNIHNNHSSNGGGNGLTVYDSLSSSHRLLPHQLTNNDNNNDDNTTKGVAWYACGPTVYDSAHLGHARTYVTLDILRRISLHHSYRDARAPRPMLVMNITDVDDKIIARSQRQQQQVHDDGDGGGDVKMMDPLVLARRYENEFWKDMDRLNVLRPDVVCRVSEHVEGTIVPYIERIVEGGMAYVVPEGENGEGSVYFDVRAFEAKARGWTRYGKLAPEGVASSSSLEFFSWDSPSRDGRQSVDNGNVVEEEEGVDASLKKKKRDPRDFCLWKYRPQSNDNDNDNNSTLNEPASVSYPSPWGTGRPGWHVECSAMIQRLSQDFQSTHQFYVHAGGVDLKFPHHTNEIAQAEAFGIAQRCGENGDGGASDSDGGGNSSADRKEWIPHWIHTGHLYVRGRKMSKSLKNFITIREMLDNHNHSDSDNTPNEWSSPADDFRLWCLGLSGSYRGPATYSPTRMEEARVIREKWIRFLMEGQQCLDRWHQVRRDGDEEEDGDCTNHPKIWKDNDLELFRSVTQSNGNCRRALMGHTSQDGGKGSFDLDGASFVREITHIATMGMKYLEETRNNDVLTAAEPLMFALTSVRESLALVGFTEKTFKAGLSSVSSGQHFGDESNQQSGRDRSLVDAVVAFRAAVRTSAIDGIRNKDGMSAVKDVLRLCDELRDDIMPSLGVEVLDGKAGATEGETGAWRNCSPRERSPDKR